jgi:effector-binding domain-containing protein
MLNITEPVVTNRPLRYYIAKRGHCSVDAIGEAIPPLTLEVKKWLEQHSMSTAFPIFFRYLNCEHGKMTIDAGFLVDGPFDADDASIIVGEFPAGKYVSTIYSGDYLHLADVHMWLEKWVRQHELQLLEETIADQTMWGCRTEFYLNDLNELPDPATWQTEVEFLLED